MNSRHLFATGAGLLLLGTTGCPDPCLDDGLLQEVPEDCPAATGSDSASGTETESGETEELPDACDNGELDPGETDIDCGGTCSNLCGDGQSCEGDDDCESNACSDEGECVSPSCNNDAQDGDETDVDCGGSCEDGCGEGQGCESDDDCASANCLTDGTCGPATGEGTCDDGIQDGDETDVDCGGPDCDACDAGAGCTEAGDCMSGVCTDGTCADPACDDGIQNGDESDVDCGGDTCDGCPDAGGCSAGSDCASGVCESDICQAATCDDGIQNGDESDVDCGGDNCDACDDGEGCSDGSDCGSGVCEDDLCQPPACDDGVLNGDETDVDCGGDTCDGCDPGGTCMGPDDCLSGGCTDMSCNDLLSVMAGPSCSDVTGGGSVALDATAMGGTGGPYTYSWTPDDGTLDAPDQASTNATPTGFQTYTVTANDGVNTAQDTVVVLNSSPFDLQDGCTLYSGDFGGMTAATITYDAGGTRACENGNNAFGLHLCEEVVFENTRLTGRIEVTDAADDDDWIGVVWGAQDNANFYSLAWKAGAQMTGFGCTAPEGILVKRIEADSFMDVGGPELYCPSDTEGSTVLALPAETTTSGWVAGQQYDVVIDYTPTQSAITITPVGGGPDVASFTIVDSTFPSGSFGSTTTSQANACVGPLFGQCLGG